MRSATLAAVLLGADAASKATMVEGERDFASYTFEDYLAEFPKNYATEELDARKATFNANLQIIKEHNSNADKTYFLTVNEFADWTNEEFRSKRMGARPYLDQMEYVGELEVADLEGLPDSVDWRTTSGVALIARPLLALLSSFKQVIPEGFSYESAYIIMPYS